jgi:hypothetical protein
MSADRVIGLFVSNETIHKKISGLLFYNLFGVIYLYIIYLSIFNYIYAISNSVLLYLTAQVFTSVLFMLAPIFFIFILFKQTRTFFDNWTNSIIGFALQQIFLVFTISLFNVFIYNLVKVTLGFRVCWDTIWRITSMAGSLSLFSFWTVSDAPSFLNQTQEINFKGDFNRASPSFPMIISLWSVTLLMKSFVNQITDLVSLLTGGIQASTLGDGIRGGMNKLQNGLNEKLNSLYGKTGIKDMVERADKGLFNSGIQAKQARKEEKENQKNDRELRNKMLKSADKAEKEFKINNLKSDNRLSGNDLNKKLQEVRKDAMMKKAMSKGIGKDSDQMKKLMKSSNTIDEKGRIIMPKTDNVFNAARMMVQNLASDRGGYINLAKDVASGIKNMANNPAGALKNMVSSPTESLKGALKSDTLDKKASNVDNAISEKDAKKALKDLDPDKRDKVMNDIKSSPNPNDNKEKIDIKPSDNNKSNAENRLQAYVNKQNQKDRE